MAPCVDFEFGTFPVMVGLVSVTLLPWMKAPPCVAVDAAFTMLLVIATSVKVTDDALINEIGPVPFGPSPFPVIDVCEIAILEAEALIAATSFPAKIDFPAAVPVIVRLPAPLLISMALSDAFVNVESVTVSVPAPTSAKMKLVTCLAVPKVFALSKIQLSTTKLPRFCLITFPVVSPK